VTLNRAGADMKSLRHIIGFQPGRVEPLFQRLGLTRMPKRVPEPNAFERRHFVESGASPRFECEVRVSPHADIQNVLGLAKIIRDFESQRRRQLIVRVQRRRVAVDAALLLEDDLAPACVSLRQNGLRSKNQVANRCFWSYDSEYLSPSP